MDHKWLEDFIALARERSFSRAAEQRHVTQPQFSRRIRALELLRSQGIDQLHSRKLRSFAEVAFQ